MTNQGKGLKKGILPHTSEALLHIKLLVIIYQLRHNKCLLKETLYRVAGWNHFHP